MIELIDIGAILASGYALLTAVIYSIIFLFVLNDRNRTFSTVFFQMFLILAAVDLLAIVNNFVGVSLPAWSIFKPFDNEVLKMVHPNMTLTITWFCRYAQGFSVITIACNRATAFLVPMKHDKIWRHKFARKIWLLQIIPPFIVGLVVLFIMEKKYDFFPDRELRYVLTIFANHEQRIKLYRFSYIIEGIKLLLLFSTQGFYVIQLFRRSRDINKTSRAEKAAANMIFCVFCVEIIYLAYTGLMVLLVPVPTPDSTSLNSIMTDFYSSINCYIAIFFSKSLRTSIQRAVRNKCTIMESLKARAVILVVGLSSDRRLVSFLFLKMNNVAPSKDEVNNNACETKNAEDPEKKNDEEKQKVEEPAIDMDEFIATILSVGTPGCSLTETVKADTIVAFCAIAKESFTRQPFMIEIDGPVKICGDTHGQYSDVLRLLDRGGFPPYSNYLFLGDYVDRGHQSLEVILLFMAFKIKYESNFFILRGNHECPAINRAYGFFEECQRRYDARIWNIFQDTFAQMPYVALVGGRILCMHGGISPLLHSLQQLRDIKERPLDPANPSLLMDLLWADPDPNTKKVPDKPNGFHPNARGVSYTFGCDVVDEYVYKLGVDLIVRAHQVVQDGYEFMANKKLVTIFSAPHYCGQFSNFAAMMVVDANNVCSFHILQPKEKDKPTKVAKK